MCTFDLFRAKTSCIVPALKSTLNTKVSYVTSDVSRKASPARPPPDRCWQNGAPRRPLLLLTARWRFQAADWLLLAGCCWLAAVGCCWLLSAAAGSCCRQLLLAATRHGWLPVGCCWLLLAAAGAAGAAGVCSWLLLAADAAASSGPYQLRPVSCPPPPPRTVLLGKPRKISIWRKVAYKSMARANTLPYGPLVKRIDTQTTPPMMFICFCGLPT